MGKKFTLTPLQCRASYGPVFALYLNTIHRMGRAVEYIYNITDDSIKKGTAEHDLACMLRSDLCSADIKRVRKAASKLYLISKTLGLAIQDV